MEKAAVLRMTGLFHIMSLERKEARFFFKEFTLAIDKEVGKGEVERVLG